METTGRDVMEGPSTTRRTFKSEEMRKCGRTRVCLYTSKMEVKLQLCVLMLLINVSLAVPQRVTLLKGQTLDLRCSIKSHSRNTHVEWRNPDGVRDKRYSLSKLSESEFNIRISNVTFSDGGRYTCSHYLHHAKEKTVEVTVLGRPQMQYITHEGKDVIKCTAEGTHPPPEISWVLKNGPEFHNHPQIIHEDKKFVTIAMLNIKPAEKGFTVKCIVRHPDLHTKTLTDFVKIKPQKKRVRPRTTPSLPETTPASEFSTLTPQSTISDAKETVPTEFFSAPSQLSTGDFPNEAVTTEFPSATIQLNTSGASTILPDFTTTQNQTSRISNTTNGWTSVAMTTDISFNRTQKNSTDIGYDLERHKGNDGNTSLLVFLVTCLILGLLVVVIFIAIKLRRAHITWKRENDDTDTSESSSKSKSSQEEKNAQRRRGFTQYVVQEPIVITSVTNPTAMTSTEEIAQEQPSPAQLPLRSTAQSNIKETEL